MLRAVSSVLLVRTVNGAVLMVRRRSTVRFRNGAPGHEKFSNDSNERRGTSRKRRSSAPMAAKAPMAQPEPGRQLLKVAVGGPSWDSLVTARTRSPWAGRPAAGRFSPGEPHQDPGSVWRLLVSSGSAGPGGNECLDRGCESGMGGDERGQDAGPPVHAVRVQDVLQLDGLGALPGALRTCRIERVACSQTYALTWMSPTVASIVIQLCRSYSRRAYRLFAQWRSP